MAIWPEEACKQAMENYEGQTIGQDYFYVYELGRPRTIEVRQILKH